MAENTNKEEVKMSDAERIQYLELQVAELTGKTPSIPRPKKNPEFSYEKDHGVRHMNEIPVEGVAGGLKEGAVRLIPNKVILKPTKENPHHPQGVEFECDSKLAEEFIRKGFAYHVRTKAEDDKLRIEAERRKKAAGK